MIPFSIFVSGSPAAQGSKRAVGRRKNGSTILIEQSARVAPWRADIVAEAQRFIRGTGAPWVRLDGPLVVRLAFFVPRPPSVKRADRERPTVAPDVDKMIRAVHDALTTAGVWADDARVVDVHATEHYDDDHQAGVSIYVEPIKEG